MLQSTQRQGWRDLRLVTALLALAIALTLAGCSTTGGGTNYSLGLAGSTADHPSQPPTIAASGPGGTYAFVYDNQIWLRQDGQAQAKQLTHMVLSNGATLLWGPLIWSPSGSYIAFSLIENLTPDAPTRTSGPLNYVDTRPGPHFGYTYSTGGSGNIYGHSYAWWDDYALFYSTGSGIMLFDLGDCDPRVWQVLSPFSHGYGDATNYSGGNVTYSDIAVNGDNQLLATQITLQSPGNVGRVGAASVHVFSLPVRSGYGGYESLNNGHASANCQQGNDEIPAWLNVHFQNVPPSIGSYVRDQGDPLADLGIAYSDPAGNIVTGAWQMTGNGTIVAQRIDSVDTKAGIVSSKFCIADNCSMVRGADKYPIAAHPALGISGNGKHVAFVADKLYVDGNGAVGDADGHAAPAWGPGDVAVATQLVSQSTDASGVLRSQTSLVMYSGGKASTVLIAGAQDLSWK